MASLDSQMLAFLQQLRSRVAPEAQGALNDVSDDEGADPDDSFSRCAVRAEPSGQSPQAAAADIDTAVVLAAAGAW